MADHHSNTALAAVPPESKVAAQVIAGGPNAYGETFLALVNLDCKNYAEAGRNGFTYLSWSFAIDQLLKTVPDAKFKICEFGGEVIRNPITGNIETDEFGDPLLHNGEPFQKTGVGYFVKAKVLVRGVAREIRLPVLGENNEPLESPNAFDINTSGMRVLVKAIALHGLGLYLYSGEDVPGAGTGKAGDKKAAVTSTPHAIPVASGTPQTGAALLDSQLKRVQLANSETLGKMYARMAEVFPDEKDLAQFSAALEKRAQQLYPNAEKLAAFYAKAKPPVAEVKTDTVVKPDAPPKAAAQPKEAKSKAAPAS